MPWQRVTFPNPPLRFEILALPGTFTFISLDPLVQGSDVVAIILTQPEKSASHVNAPVKLSVEAITPAEGLFSDQTTGKFELIREVSPPPVGHTGKGVVMSTKIVGELSTVSAILIVKLEGGPCVPSQFTGVAITSKVPQKPGFQFISPVKESIDPGLVTPVRSPPGNISDNDHSMEA